MKVISERLGHANVAITLDTYSHVLPAADEAADQTALVDGPAALRVVDRQVAHAVSAFLDHDHRAL